METGETVSFSIQLDANAEGSYDGNVAFATNDADENPFDFALSGTVAIPPPVEILDNGDADFSTIGEWTAWGNQGYQSDVHESLAGDGTDVATWTFDRLLPGEYWVAATWTDYSNRASNAPFTIRDDTTTLATVQVDQQIPPADFSEDGVQWELLGGTYTSSTGTLLVELNDDADGRLNADAIRIERLPDSPEILVSVDGGSIPDEAGVVDFGSSVVGAPVTKLFTVRNLGTQVLTLSAPSSIPAGFSLSSSFSDTELAKGESATFQLQLDASTVGRFGGEFSFGNNDADENPFSFQLEAKVVQIIDDGDPAFTTTGEWTSWSGQGYQDDIHESLSGSGEDVASWTFAGLPAGWYQLAATWSTYTNRASDAPFSIVGDDATTVRLNQQVLPDDFSSGGVTWEYLGGIHSTTNGTIVVQLADDADGRLNADAVRIEPILQQPELQVDVNGQEVVDGSGIFDYGITPAGQPLTQDFTVTNLGGLPLVLNAQISVPAGFTLVNGFGTTTLQTGESTDFSIRLDSVTNGSYEGEVSFNSNDDDEDPFGFTISGIVASSPPVEVIDNGDPRFTATGEWTQWFGQGYSNDVHESLPGTGDDIARWTFSNLQPGTYQVAATWTAYSNRATNAPFIILDGIGELETVTVDQQIAPVGFSEGGAIWQFLGQPHQVTDTLTIELKDHADGRLNADAIRIERLDPELRIVDNGDPGFTSIGEWTEWTGQGYANDVHESLAGIGDDVASWTFPGMLPGTYRISATWSAYSNRAPDAPFTILDGATSLGTFSINQQVSPDDFSDQGVMWEDLGGTHAMSSGTLVIQLHDAANGRLNADAIRIERLVQPSIAGGQGGFDERQRLEKPIRAPSFQPAHRNGLSGIGLGAGSRLERPEFDRLDRPHRSQLVDLGIAALAQEWSGRETVVNLTGELEPLLEVLLTELLLQRPA